jgi:long-chain acyl-CoA synthetase
MLYNRAYWFELYFGLAKVGIIAVPVNFRFAVQEVEYVLNNSESKMLIYEEAFSNIIDIAKEKTPSVQNYMCISPGQKDSGYEKWLLDNSADEPSTEAKETDPFFIAYTSGTTGFPKGTVVPHRNFILNLMITASELSGLNKTDTMLVIMPVFHSNSTWFGMLMCMLGGTNVIYHSGGFNPEEILQIIEKEKVTWTSVVPTMLTMILNLPDNIKNSYNLSSMRTLVCSSAPLMTKTKEDTVAFFKGIDIYEGYGSTETGWVTMLRPEDQLTKVRSVGLPVFGKEVRLLDEQGNDVPAGQIGELFARGIGITIKEYWCNPEGTAKAFHGDWFTVGDMARCDEEGYIYLGDRKSDMIISGGENVYPMEVENLVARHPKVAEVAVVGVPDELWGERVHAVIKLKEGEVSDQEEIIDFCRGKIAGYKRPRSVDFADELPKSATGKILRRKVREPYWA